MAQLKDLLVAGPSRFIGDMFGTNLQITKINAPTAAGGAAYGVGSTGQALCSDGTSVYWGYPTSSAHANLVTATNSVAYFTNTTGSFGSKPSANGALYATSANGALQWGTLPVGQGGTGATTFTSGALLQGNGGNAISAVSATTGSNVKPIYINAGKPTAVSREFLQVYNGGAIDVDTIKDASMVMVQNGTNGPAVWGNVITMPYRKPTGNTTADYLSQIFIPTGDVGTYGNTMYYRTSTSADNYKAWQTVVHHASSTADIGGTGTPVYVDKAGLVKAITSVATAFGGTGNTSFTANRLVYSESATKLASATSIYASTNSIAINATSIDKVKLYQWDISLETPAMGLKEYTPVFEANGKSIFKGTIAISSNQRAIEFRPDYSKYSSYMYYGTTGNEALNFVNAQAVTSFIFWTGWADSSALDDSSAWNTTTTIPAIQIKQNSLYVNTKIASGTNAAYKFYVTGTSYLNGATTVNNTLTVSNGTTLNSTLSVVGITTMAGKLNPNGGIFWNSTSLPEVTSASYLLAIDAFADGGRTKWISVANACTSIVGTPTVTIGAGTASNAPTVSVKIGSKTGTSGGITKATTGLWGVTKLSSTSSTSEETLAATPKGVWAAIDTVKYKVQQMGIIANAEYPMLLKGTANTTSETGNLVNFGNKSNYVITANPSTGTITANTYKVTTNGTITYNSANGCIEIIV